MKTNTLTPELLHQPDLNPGEKQTMMTTRQINVQRLSIISTKPFESVVAALDAAVGRPGMSRYTQAIAESKTYAELEKAIHPMLGKSGFMEFVRFDLGAVLAKALGPRIPKSLRLVVGNPLIMQAMVRHVPDAGSYAPVTLLIDEREDGVHLSYDEMASFLASYGNPEALQVARELDAKIRKLLTEAA
jgi:uncharacterized protein (DUF302 family)